MEDQAAEDDPPTGLVHLRNLERRQGAAQPDGDGAGREESDSRSDPREKRLADRRPQVRQLRLLLLGPGPQATRHGREGQSLLRNLRRLRNHMKRAYVVKEG